MLTLFIKNQNQHIVGMKKLKCPIIGRNIFCFAFILSVLCSNAMAMDNQGRSSEFDAWKKKQAEDFNAFQTAEDKEFVEFLRKEWEEFEVFKGRLRDTLPKPAVAPKVANNSAINPNSRHISQAKSQRIAAATRPPGFYGHALPSLHFPVTKIAGLKRPSEQSLANAWNTLSQKNHTMTLTMIRRYQTQLDLGDWGVIAFLDYILAPVFSDSNSRNCYKWFLLTKLGYDVRVGYTFDSVVLMGAAQQQVYGVRYSQVEKKDYYVLPPLNQQQDIKSPHISSYNGQIFTGLKAFDFSLKSLIKPTMFNEERKLEYKVQGQELSFGLHFDAGLSTFLKTYPQIGLPGYFETGPGSPAIKSLHNQLQPHIANLSKREALDFLLGFTQAVFQYQTDDQQFGQEKYLAIEESLYYGINDCEDRSIFLSWLIFDLLGMDVVVLDYPGHIALAVRTKIRPMDDYIEHQGKKYLVVDPTFINAKAGMAMPEFKNVVPEVIKVQYETDPQVTQL